MPQVEEVKPGTVSKFCCTSQIRALVTKSVLTIRETHLSAWFLLSTSDTARSYARSACGERGGRAYFRAVRRSPSPSPRHALTSSDKTCSDTETEAEAEEVEVAREIALEVWPEERASRTCVCERDKHVPFESGGISQEHRILAASHTFGKLGGGGEQIPTVQYVLIVLCTKDPTQITG